MSSRARSRTYLVECFWPGVTVDEAVATARRARAAASSLSRDGHELQLLCSILVPGDETVFHLFDGEEADVRAASEQAGMPFERVLESVCIDGGRTEGQGR